jgi:hypothetical protein
LNEKDATQKQERREEEKRRSIVPLGDIKDLLNRLRAHCARWSEVLNYQCTA